MRQLFPCSVWAAIVLSLAPADAAGAPVAAVLRLEQRLDADATRIAASPDGRRVLVYGAKRATLLAPDATAKATVEMERLAHGAVADDGTFVLAHGGGITVHAPGNRREQLRIAAPPGVTGVAISADGARIAVATGESVTVSDAVTGRPKFAVNQAASAVRFDAEDTLWATHEGGTTRYDTRGRGKADPEMPPAPGLVADGCVGGPAEAGGLCLGGPVWSGEDGLVVLDAEGSVERWTLLGAGEVEDEPATPEITRVVPVGAADVLVARADGTLERRGAGGVVSVPLPGCAPCEPDLGGDDAGFWALGAGTLQAWDAAGQPTLKRPVETEVVAAGRLADGRWAGLDPDGRVRIGAKLGKGKPRLAVPSPVGLDAAGDSVAVWSATAVQVLDGEGLLRSTPGIGADRAPAAVRVSPDGSRVAVIDDAGALHLYEATGRPVFRLQVGLQGTALAFDAGGSLLLAGGAPLRGFRTVDGAEEVRILVAGAEGIEDVVVRGDGGLVLVQRGADGQTVRTVSPGVLAPTVPAEDAPDAPAPEEAAAGG